MRLLCFFLLCGLFWQCQDTCTPTQERMAMVKFMDYKTKQALPDSIRFFKISGEGRSRLYSDSAHVTTLLTLPLSPAVDSVRYAFECQNGKTYNFVIHYERKPTMTNPECGIGMDYVNLKKGTHSQVDSVALISPNVSVSNATTPNFVLYIQL